MRVPIIIDERESELPDLINVSDFQFLTENNVFSLFNALCWKILFDIIVEVDSYCVLVFGWPPCDQQLMDF